MYTHGGLAAIICNSPNVTNCTLKIQYLSVSTTCKFSDFNNPTQKKRQVTCNLPSNFNILIKSKTIYQNC